VNKDIFREMNFLTSPASTRLHPPGCELSFEVHEKISLDGCLPDGSHYSTVIKSAGIVALIVMKALAMNIRQKSKDAYGVWFCLANYPGNIESVACIYYLPDKTSRPLYGAIFVLVSILFICSLFLRLWKKRLQYNKQNPDFISNAVVYDRSEKDSRTQLSEAIQQWISVASVIVVSFIGVLAAYTCMYSLPDKVSRPFIGSLFYLISAAALGSFFIQQWRGAKSFLAYDIDNMGDRIIIRECFSEKLRKWILAICVAGYTLLSIATAILCLFFGLPDRSVRPDAAVFFLFSGISAITMLTYSLWKNQSGRRFIDPIFKGL
jgi:hypothetical protein